MFCRGVLALDALNIYNAAVTAALPNRMVKSVVSRDADGISVCGKRYGLNGKTVHMVGFGKAVIGMARAVQDVLRDSIEGGVIIVPHGTVASLQAAGKVDLIPENDGKLELYEGAKNNLPDADSEKASHKLLNLVKSLSKDSILVVLVSGGGSALLSAPMPPVTLDDKKLVTNMISNCGADIRELNVVRKNLSLAKGGKLGKLAAPAQVISMMLSDIIGDPLDQIASGPTIENSFEDPQAALSILRKYNLEDKVPASVMTCLRSNALHTVVHADNSLQHVDNFLIGSNEVAINAALTTAQKSGYVTVTLSRGICGDARRFGVAVARLSRFLVDLRLRRTSSVCEAELAAELARHGVKSADLKQLWSLAEGCDRLAVVTGGETVVNVVGGGVGGRNQETVLACSLALSDLYLIRDASDVDLLFLSAGTDGIDGPTDCAGALAYIGQVPTAKALGGVAQSFLDNNDSNTFFKMYCPQDLIVTGITGTNVMDVHVLLLCFKS